MPPRPAPSFARPAGQTASERPDPCDLLPPSGRCSHHLSRPTPCPLPWRYRRTSQTSEGWRPDPLRPCWSRVGPPMAPELLLPWVVVVDGAWSAVRRWFPLACRAVRRWFPHLDAHQQVAAAPGRGRLLRPRPAGCQVSPTSWNCGSAHPCGSVALSVWLAMLPFAVRPRREEVLSWGGANAATMQSTARRTANPASVDFFWFKNFVLLQHGSS